MVSLTLMARLLDAVRPDARLVLVGDPEQLASVEAGAVLGDIVDAGRAARVDSGIDPVLRRSWRFTGHIAELAEAIQTGDADAAWICCARPRRTCRSWRRRRSRREPCRWPAAVSSAGCARRWSHPPAG